MKKILIFGSSGRLGEYIKKKFKNKYELFTFGYKKKKYQVDLLNKSEILKVIIKNKPDVIINCAGATDVEKCIKNYNYAYRGNTIIPRNIISVLKGYRNKPHIIHFSTDQVYNKNKNRSSEKDLNLSNNYSKTKFYGEKEIRKIKNYTIIRTNFFGNMLSKKNMSFSDFIRKSLQNNKKIKMAKNIYYNPINIENLIKYLEVIIKKNIKGTYNIGSKNNISKLNFAKMTCKYYKLNSNLIIPYISNFKNNNRPLNTSTDVRKFEKKIKKKMPVIFFK